jgi:ABC-type oligopeptide transport system substrate-binding subunit/class 3 adenylate cyclase
LGDTSIAAQANKLQDLRDSAPKGLQEKLRLAKTEIEGQRKPVTIFFADIVGSTSIAEKLDPEEWKEVVQGAHHRVSEAIHRYEGTIAQLLGDGVLAFFGAPLTHENDPERAVRAALDLQESIADYRRQLAGFVDDFHMRVGIHTGEVVVGQIGTDEHAEYLAIGDTVNVAARIESAAQPGEVLVSETCVRLIEHAFELGELESIKAKGKTEPVRAAVVWRLKDDPDLARGIGGVRAPFVGREAEVAQVEQALLALCQGQGQVVALLGDAGIGKTRLLEQVRERTCGGEPQDQATHFEPSTIRWLEGRALSYGSSLSFWPINQLLLDDLGLTDGAQQVKIMAAMRKRLLDLFGAEKASSVLPYLAHLLELTLEGDEGELIQHMDGEAIKYQTLIYLSDYFERVATNAPTVLVIEDLHWADPSSLEVLERLLALTDRVPLMVALLMRVDREHGSWDLKTTAEKDFPHRTTEITLHRLGSQESQTLVEQLLGAEDLPDEIRELIMIRSEGNPFYLEEVVRHLLESGLIQEMDGQWVVADEIDTLGIPDTLQGVLLARIDRLEEDVRDTLQRASVIGKSFLYKLLQSIAEAERELESHLSQLQRVDLVREKTRLPELEYIFKHSLTQEAAYNSLLLERRKAFHRQVGVALEQLFPDRQEEFLGLLAHHFKAAGDLEKAADYLIRAGDKARLADAHDEAVELYKGALPILQAMNDQVRAHHLWLDIGLSFHINSKYSESKKAYENAHLLMEGGGPADSISEEVSRQAVENVRTLRISANTEWIQTFDPGKIIFEWSIIPNCFSGLTRMEDMMSVKPHLAWSWDISDDGKRYLFHLRDDACWTDGTRITADQFEWAWIRNLSPDVNAPYAWSLFDIVGARDYQMGLVKDPNKVGIRSLDPLTLEVTLCSPANYFLYIAALPITYPLPRWIIEEFGEGWWKPEHIVSNGPFRLDRFDTKGITLVRDYGYFMPSEGNLDQIRTQIFTEDDLFQRRQQLYTAYRNRQIDVCDVRLEELPADFPELKIHTNRADVTMYLFLNPSVQPLDKKIAREALALAIDAKTIDTSDPWVTPATGGLVHPSTPGHSPGIHTKPDAKSAKTTLHDAGFPKGKGFPQLELAILGSKSHRDIGHSIASQLADKLSIKVIIRQSESLDENLTPHLILAGWIPDYPDPDSILRRSSIYSLCEKSEHKKREFTALLKEAENELDRRQRLSHYRRIDRWLVSEEILFIPLFYAAESLTMQRPNIRNIPRTNFNLENVIITG